MRRFIGKASSVAVVMAVVAACSGGAHKAAPADTSTTSGSASLSSSTTASDVPTTTAGTPGTKPKTGKKALVIPIPANDVSVGNYVGQTLAQVQRTFATNGLILHVLEQPTTQMAQNGTIGEQDPMAMALLPRGGSVTVVVLRYSGTATTVSGVTVPSVLGKSQAQAQSILQQDGLVVRFTSMSTARQADNGMVVAQSPAGGTQVASGATVVLSVGRYAG